MTERSSQPIVIVGGGLAGLVAGLSLARRGAKVEILERGADPGGRARSVVRDGYVWNQGPHAVYRAGAFARALRSLEIRTAGRKNELRGSLALLDGGAHPLPATPLALLGSSLLSPRERFAFGRYYFQLGLLDAASFAEVTLADFLAARLPEGRARLLGEALARLATYGGDATRMSAECAIRQQKLADAGVDYVDGGWQSIVDSLVDALTARGVTIRAHAKAVGLETVDGSHVVRTADGGSIRAAAVVIASALDEASALVPGDAALRTFAEAASPVRAACLDLGLARVPAPRMTFSLGLDRPTYASLHSATARLSPVGGGLLHAAVYLGGTTIDADEARRLCEAAVETLQPGYRDGLAHERFLPSMTVHHALVTAEMGGFRGRPGVAVGSRPGVFVAGDWVGDEGLLADASAASGLRAADAAFAHATSIHGSRHAA